MSIIYALIAKSNEKVLCEYTDYHGNFEQVSRSLLKKVQKDHKATFSYDDAFFFHYSNFDNITYMCMCEIKYPKEVAFLFLNEIKDNFLQTFNENEIKNAISYSLNTAFGQIIRNKIDYYNKNLEILDKLDAITELKEGVLNAHQTMMEASDILSQRGDKINLIVKKADTLKSESNSYFENAKRVRRDVRMRRLKIILFIIVSVLIIGYLLSVILCGGFNYEGCRSE